MYTSFNIYHPECATKFTPEEPQSDLLQGVINCGVIDIDTLIEYEEDNNGVYTAVPSEIRQQAKAYWDEQLGQ